MKRNILKSGLLTIAMIAICSTAFAQDSEERQNHEPPTVEEIFKKLDTDEDGKISKKEVKGPLKKDFAKIDTDEDGFISKKEMEEAPKPKRQGSPKDRQ